MSEQEAVDNAPLPRTRQSLADDLRALGVEAGMTLIMHSSLKSLGWVCGGPVAVIQALMDVVTASGTIVVPTQTSDYSDPALWQHPPVPQSWWQIMADPEVTVVVHGGREEVRFCLTLSELRPTKLVDIQVAEGIRSPSFPLGYTAMVARVMDEFGYYRQVAFIRKTRSVC